MVKRELADKYILSILRIKDFGHSIGSICDFVIEKNHKDNSVDCYIGKTLEPIIKTLMVELENLNRIIHDIPFGGVNDNANTFKIDNEHQRSENVI